MLKFNLTTAFLQFPFEWQCVLVSIETHSHHRHRLTENSVSIGLFAKSVWFYSSIVTHRTPLLLAQEIYTYAIHSRVERKIFAISVWERELDRASKPTRISSVLRATTRAWRSISRSFIFRMSFNSVKISSEWCSSNGMGRPCWNETPKYFDRATPPLYTYPICNACVYIGWMVKMVCLLRWWFLQSTFSESTCG